MRSIHEQCQGEDSYLAPPHSYQNGKSHLDDNLPEGLNDKVTLNFPHHSPGLRPLNFYEETSEIRLIAQCL